jgi:hypothetical protein
MNIFFIKIKIIRALQGIIGSVGKYSMKRLHGGDFISFRPMVREILNIE